MKRHKSLDAGHGEVAAASPFSTSGGVGVSTRAGATWLRRQDRGRYFVALSLAEGETLRRILHCRLDMICISPISDFTNLSCKVFVYLFGVKSLDLFDAFGMFPKLWFGIS